MTKANQTNEQTNNKKSWEIKNLSNSKGEVLIYGDIETYQWLEEDVTAFTFSKELRELGNISELDVRINSGGGSVFAAQAIYSQLKQHNATVSVYIDGLAASAASLIAMAGDNIYMPVNAVMMIHNPATIALGEKKDMEKTIDMLDKVKDTIIATYEAKTGLSYDELSKMMDEETWLTGSEAVELGFADELLDSVDVVASLKGNQLTMNGVKHDLSIFTHKPAIHNHEMNPQPPAEPVDNKVLEEEEEEELKTIEELKNKYPDLYNQVYEEGITAENTRIKEIEELPSAGYEKLVTNAKYETKASASQLAIDILKAQKDTGAQYLKDRNEDADPLNDVPGDEAPENHQSEEQEIEAGANQLAAIMNKKRGGA